MRHAASVRNDRHDRRPTKGTNGRLTQHSNLAKGERGWAFRAHGVNDDTTQRSKGQRFVRFLLRYIGGVSLLAVIAVFMPFSWMDAVHRYLGMGPLPAEPFVGYLARSLSAFYALLGGLLWVLSFDLHRHRAALSSLGVAFILLQFSSARSPTRSPRCFFAQTVPIEPVAHWRAAPTLHETGRLPEGLLTCANLRPA